MNPIGGSNFILAGAKKFHTSQNNVQAKMIRKKPIVPTCWVMNSASLSSGLSRERTSWWTLRSGLRRFLSSASDSAGLVVSVVDMRGLPEGRELRQPERGT